MVNLFLIIFASTFAVGIGFAFWAIKDVRDKERTWIPVVVVILFGIAAITLGVSFGLQIQYGGK